jgi:rhodanese-related sulfurtransferase
MTTSGKTYPAEIVILAIGVRPDTTLARAAGLEIGERGGIRVDEHMRTTDPNIFAVGDAIEVKDFVTGEWSLVALAGPANRQGRIAADVIAGRDSRYRGTQGTAIIGLFGGAAAWTGASERMLTRLGDRDLEKIYLFPNAHAGYYPGAKFIGLKLIFRASNGRVLGAQAIGQDGPAVDKRISAIAVAIQMGATIHDLEEAELCYAPQFGSAKDPVNFAGMVAANALHGDMPVSHWDTLDGAFLLDVRQPVELVVESVPGAVNIPLHELRARLAELPRDREIHVICRSAQRAYYATRILLQHGFKARNISGGMLSRAMFGFAPVADRDLAAV